MSAQNDTNDACSYVISAVLSLTAPARQTSHVSGNTSWLFSMDVPSPNGMFRLPFVTAGSFRGRLRRSCGERVIEAVRRRGEKLDQRLIASILRGSHGRSAVDHNATTFGQRIAAAEDVFGHVFGGGSAMHHAALKITRPLWVIVKESASLVPAAHAARATLSAFCQASGDPSRDIARASLTRMLRSFPGDHVRGGRHAANLDPDDDDGDTAVVAEDAGALESDATDAAPAKSGTTRNIVVAEVIPPGMELSLELRLDDATPAQLGLVLLGLRDLFNQGYIGGDSARGMGSYNVVFSDLQSAGRSGQLRSIVKDDLVMGRAPGIALCRNPRVQEAVAAAESALDELTVESLRFIFPTDVRSKRSSETEPGMRRRPGRSAKKT